MSAKFEEAVNHKVNNATTNTNTTKNTNNTTTNINLTNNNNNDNNDNNTTINADVRASLGAGSSRWCIICYGPGMFNRVVLLCESRPPNSTFSTASLQSPKFYIPQRGVQWEGGAVDGGSII